MNRMHSVAVAAILTLAGVTSVSTAQAAEQVWTGAPQHWSSPASSDCRLVVQSVLQPRPGQPFQVVAANTGRGMLRYSFSIRVTQAGKEEFRSVVVVAKSKAGEVSTRSTSTAYAGSLKGAVVGVTLSSCSVIG